MAIIVELKTTKRRFFLLGTGFGMYKATRPSFFGGNLLPNEEEGKAEVVAVCDENGDIFFMDKASLKVISIDDTPLESMRSKLEVPY
ncbi:hypothetical protein KHM83_13840 [Fusibacter paucivorans]|uniref:Uncharacterized protein n=1 Tax=Fusibacter paucivorans TaxID=76009 RepID=A0ABS5PT78_9FIRM|nr:hypothetical protein [Fusibacter paucivorans]MBS7527761.1 hypothetical protein [Fusibacter paucivorans]